MYNSIPMTALQARDPTGDCRADLVSVAGTQCDGHQQRHASNNYTANGSGSFNDYQYTGRVDYSASQKLQIFGRYTHAHFLLSGKPVFGTQIGGPGLGYLGLAGQSLIQNYSLATGFNYTLSSSLLTDFRFGYFRYNPHSTKYDRRT